MSEEIDEVLTKLDTLEARLEDLFEEAFARDLARYVADMETVEEVGLDAIRTSENPSDALKTQVAAVADAALNAILSQYQNLDSRLSADQVAPLLNASYAIGIRL